MPQPLSAFINGIEYICALAAELKARIKSCLCDPNSSSRSSAEDSGGKQSSILNELRIFALDTLESIKSSLDNTKNINSFMLMSINRCIDFTKSRHGVQLLPRMETANFIEVMTIPVSCMQNLQSNITIEFEEVHPSMCANVITDRQWLQENVLCYLSNAVKYSSKVRGC